MTPDPSGKRIRLPDAEPVEPQNEFNMSGPPPERIKPPERPGSVIGLRSKKGALSGRFGIQVESASELADARNKLLECFTRFFGGEYWELRAYREEWNESQRVYFVTMTGHRP